MSKSYKIPLWKKAPFLRLLLPVIAGILAEYYSSFSLQFIIYLGIIAAIFFIIFLLLPIVYRFKFSFILGIIITVFVMVLGLFITWNRQVRNHPQWYGHNIDSSSFIVATLNESPVEKNKSFKAVANVQAITNGNTISNASGKVLLYFSKDSFSGNLKYGSKIIFSNKLQDIKNSSNPAAFDYKRYCAFQQIFQQAYLPHGDWVATGLSNISFYDKIKNNAQHYILSTLDKYINGFNEVGIAKALLVGYRVDLDKDLVQQYSNAGVIHIIVIAGLHLGLIYALLLWFLNRIPVLKKSAYIRLIIILICLWCFALLTGASPPVMRAVIMFSCIQIGRTISRNTSVYNSLAASAFILLCIDPFYLWDVGFQLSYLAVTGIVALHKSIFHWFYLKNKIFRAAWNIAAVSLAAQIFTMPACLYYFHQVPLLFMVTNIFAVPLATVALYGCVALVCVSSIPAIASLLGKVITATLWLLNHVVFLINAIPFSTWTDFSISPADTLLLYIIIISFLYWLISRSRISLPIALCSMLFISILYFNKKLYAFHQKKIIVYDIPNHTAIDFINSNTYFYIGDSELTKDDVLKNFHLKPSRISFNCDNINKDTLAVFCKDNFFQFYNKRVVMIDTSINYLPFGKKVDVDYIIISKNAKVRIPALTEVFNCGTYIFDASNPLWKIAKWKKDCEDLHLRFHSVPEQGAFVTDL